MQRTLGAAPKAETQAAVEAAPATGRTVLVIDDDRNTRDLLIRILTREGYRTITAWNGTEGLRLAREFHPDLITLDVMMPGMDGWTVLGELKKDESVRSIPVIMVTIDDDRGRAVALGAAEYLTKPVDRDALAEVLARYQGDSSGGELLVIDDEPNVRTLVSRIAERAGWTCREAENGVAGLDAVAAARPTLIVLDLMMPQMDGFTFAELRRAGDAAIPVLILTAMNSPEDLGRLQGNVSQIIQKGAQSPQQLEAAIRSLLQLHTGKPEAASPRERGRDEKDPIVEDNELNRDMLSRRLGRKGFVVVMAVDGREGIESVEGNADLILMDVSLFVDGHEATRRSRRTPRPSHPGDRLTAHAMVGDRQGSGGRLQRLRYQAGGSRQVAGKIHALIGAPDHDRPHRAHTCGGRHGGQPRPSWRGA